MSKFKAFLALTYCLYEILRMQAGSMWSLYRVGLREIWRA